MKKILFTIVSIAAVVAACKPVEVRDNIGGNITVDELLKQSTVTVWNEGGKNVNYVTCDTKAPVNAVWSSVTQFQGAHGDLQMFATGEQTIKLKALCADGTVLETEFKVNVEEMKYPVDPVWNILTNGSEKAWTWDDRGNVWGNGGYNADTPEAIANGSGEWWGVPASDIAGQASNYGFDTADSGNATMTFCLQGTEIRKSSGATGKFSFSMKEDAHKIGTLNTTGCGVLFPCVINVGATAGNFEIARVNETNLDLIYAADGTGDWSECTHWHFKAAN